MQVLCVSETYGVERRHYLLSEREKAGTIAAGNVLFWNYSSFCGRSRNRRQSFSQLWNPYDLGILRTFDRQFPVDVPGYRIPEKRKIKKGQKRDIDPSSDTDQCLD